MAYTRVHRLLRIVLLIQSEHGWNARRLALECGVTERTIYRDLEELEGAGVPWVYDPLTDGYRIRKDFFLPPLHLTAEEAAALHEHVSVASVNGDARNAAMSAMRKVMSILPEPVATRVRELTNGVEGAHGGDAHVRKADAH